MNDGLAALGKTIGTAVGLSESQLNTDVTGGKVIKALLV
jgi:hypothetical protein